MISSLSSACDDSSSRNKKPTKTQYIFPFWSSQDNYLCLTTSNFDLSWVTFVHIFILWKTMYDLYNEISRKGRKRKVTMQLPRWILELKLITGWDCLCKLALSNVHVRIFRTNNIIVCSRSWSDPVLIKETFNTVYIVFWNKNKEKFFDKSLLLCS